MPEVWLAPYLPHAPVNEGIGPWHFIRFQDFARRHARGKATYNQVRRLITAYKLRRVLPMFGAVVVPEGGKVGDELAREGFDPLCRALATTLINRNPSPFTNGDEHPNAGLMVASTDNAMVFPVPLGGGNSIVTVEGGFLQQVNIRYAPPGKPIPPVPPPPALPTPILGGGVDAEHADAVYATLSRGDSVARRLDRAIQWQAAAWTNTQLVGDETRVLAFRAAFDVLFGGASTRKVGAALGRLLDDQSERRLRRYTEHGRAKEVALTDTEWWFQSFALLRNALAHGSEISASMWRFEAAHHLSHADDHLRRALLRIVVEATGNAELELEPVMRSLRRTTAEFATRLRPDS
jgi:hypothetical protein